MGSFSGQEKEVVILQFILENATEKTPLIFDQTSNHTFLTTTSLSDVAGTNINFIDGCVNFSTEIKYIKVGKIPKHFALYQNFPNPFNPKTEIRFKLPRSSNIVINIYNVLGEAICTLVNAQYEQGHHKVVWNGKNKFGNDVTSGIYLYKLEAGDFSRTKKMYLIII
ncbi:T9SS type A sorting domain-containing protein [candidate division KSB1 bacterium]|nr:T9SS type A sorting domain-containing protein [candidate division KSB1 bacterium]MBL7093066.1 T9SS type A sorting domain-containing protein [candidate division KSB1 bacterium]